jgi:arylmalonate decarboxylase
MRTDASMPPVVGLIVPPASGKVPDDGEMLYPNRARFIARGLALPAISTMGYDSVIDSVTAKAVELADAGATAISLMGTSLSFYRGADFNRQLIAAIATATGLPSTTMSSAVVRALRTVGAGRVALATAYTDDVNARLIGFLEAEGFDIAAVKGLAMTDVVGVGDVTPDTLTALAQEVFAQAGTAQAVLISCGGLKTLGILERLEARLGAPVISSSPAGFWDVVHLAKIDPTVDGFGQLFRRHGSHVPA